VFWYLFFGCACITAFHCPYPNCGREFNVNSNMRRHYRNHSMAATAEVHPPRHNSGRRPRGYPRPHPGRASRSVFHVSAHGQSAGSMTEEEDEEEGRLGGGLEGGFGAERGDGYYSESDGEDDDEQEGEDDMRDEEDEAEDEDEDMQYIPSHSHTNHTKSVTWSPSQSPPAAHPHPHQRQYQDSHSRVVPATPPCTTSPRHAHAHSSPSSCVSQTYTPSSPAYVRACRDPTVSTTLRPAFR
jgi:hypothetical protein